MIKLFLSNLTMYQNKAQNKTKLTISGIKLKNIYITMHLSKQQSATNNEKSQSNLIQ